MPKTGHSGYRVYEPSFRFLNIYPVFYPSQTQKDIITWRKELHLIPNKYPMAKGSYIKFPQKITQEELPQITWKIIQILSHFPGKQIILNKVSIPYLRICFCSPFVEKDPEPNSVWVFFFFPRITVLSGERPYFFMSMRMSSHRLAPEQYPCKGS